MSDAPAPPYHPDLDELLDNLQRLEVSQREAEAVMRRQLAWQAHPGLDSGGPEDVYKVRTPDGRFVLADLLAARGQTLAAIVALRVAGEDL